MNSPLIQFTNCQLLRNGILSENDNLWVQNGKVIDPQKVFFDLKTKADQVVDCQGNLIVPGFIDIQINGKFTFHSCSLVFFSLK